MSYLLIFVVFIIVLLIGAVLEEETDASYYNQTEEVSQ
jgi:hypothetical protein